MHPTLMKKFRHFVFMSMVFVLIFVNGVAWSATSYNGALRQVGNQQILNLWGTNYEMGYAHGYLMADKIRDLIDTYLVGLIAKGNVPDYNYHLSLLPLYHTFYSESLDEVNGMMAGMIASGKSLYVPSLNRNIDDRDIKAFNLYIEFIFGCSSFGVWGTATANGESIIARNYDLDYDPQGNALKNQILITYEPTGKPKFVSITYPGLFGVVTGMNEHGVTITANSGSGDPSNGDGPFHPSAEVFRRILENTTTNNYLTQPLSVVNSADEYIPLIDQIGIPYSGSGDPVYYIEDSVGSNIIRKAADTDPAYNHIIATNHFMKVSPPPTSGDTVTRYNSLRNGLISLYGTGDHKVDSSEAWSMLSGVANIAAPTLHSIVFRPNRMEFDVSFAALVNGVFRSATSLQPQTYTWATLFPAAPLPDLVVQSIIPDQAFPPLGQPVNVTVTVKNQGSGDSGGFIVEFYRNLTAAPALLQSGDEYCVIAGLSAGATSSCTFTETYSAVGAYNTWAQVDTGQQVTELNEANNVFGPQTITVVSSSSIAAVNDTYNTMANTTLNQSAPGVLSNDTTSQGATLTAQLVSGTSHGALAFVSNGSFTYTPVANYVGSDSFTYVANDGTTTSNVATVTFTVTSTGTILFADDFTRVPGAPNPLSPWANALGTWEVTNGVLQGSTLPSSEHASIYTSSTPQWTDYTLEGRIQFPAGAFGGGLGGRVNPANGARYLAAIYPDGSVGGSNTLELLKCSDWTTFNVTPMQRINLPSVGTGWHTLKMVFTGSRIQVYYDGTMMIDQTDNNFDSRAPYLSGGVSGDMWTYTNSYVMGLDNVVVTTSAGNLPPTATNDTYSTNANTVLNQAAPGVLNNDTDPEGAILTAQLVSSPSHGTLTLNSNGSFTYTPVSNYAGSDSFTYVARDEVNNSNAATVTITVLPTLASIVVSPSTVTGGTASQGTVRLSGPAPSGGVVVLLSDNSSAAGMPASVTIPSGSSSATFTISTTAVAGTTSVIISAGYGGVTKTATLTVTRPNLSTLTVSPSTVTGGATSRGTVTLSGPAPLGGVVVSLSDNSSAATVPASVTVASGSTSATFTVTTTAVASSTSVIITAGYGGVTRTATLTVTRPVLSSLVLNPTSVKGGATSRGTVTLNGPAPSGGVVVSLSDNSSSASEPASVTIPSGSSSATFTVSTTAVTSFRLVTISATYGGVTKSAILRVTR